MAKARRDSSLAIDPVPDGYMLVWVVDGETGAVVGEMPDASFPDPGECPSYDAFREDWEFAETQRVAALTGEYSGDDAYRRGLVWRSRKGVREALKAIQEAWKAVPSEKSYLAARKSALEAKALEGCIVELVRPVTTVGGRAYPVGSRWKVVLCTPRKGATLVGVDAEGKRLEGNAWCSVREVTPDYFEVVSRPEGLPRSVLVGVHGEP